MAEGHRKRLIDKALNNGFDTFESHEFLELFLFMLIPRVNTNPIAHELINRFGSFCKACNAPISELMKVKGIGEQTARRMKRFSVLVNEYRMSIYSKNMNITNDDTLAKYASFFLSESDTKKLYAFCLNSHNDLTNIYYVADIDEITQDDIQEFIKRVIATSATQVVLASNQLENTNIASQEDLSVGMEIKRALKTVGITMRNHIITSDFGHISNVFD